MDDFSFLISTVVPSWLKNFPTFEFGGQIGTGPFFKDIGGKGIALIILALTFIACFNWDKVIVEIKLITVWLDLNFNSLIILFPTVGVTAKKIQSQLSIISWLSFATETFLYFFSEGAGYSKSQKKKKTHVSACSSFYGSLAWFSRGRRKKKVPSVGPCTSNEVFIVRMSSRTSTWRGMNHPV